ncbi:MAG: hypothetical protein KAI81_03795, partial [Candidatus Marinimicrobia bacterium]|nr:hypothetical protein [Candidatus Neomarinimicrobiota bacterium]
MSYSAFIPAGENVLIINGSIHNNSPNKERIELSPVFSISRPFIYDHYENYSNVFIDEYSLSYGFANQKNPVNLTEMAAPGLFTLSSGERKSFQFIIAIDTDNNRAVALYEKMASLENVQEYAEASWEKWLSEGSIPDFSDSLNTTLYKLNLISLKALNLNGAVPADISGQFVTNSLPQLYPRDAFMTARALLETGHIKECDQILEYWTRRSMKQEGEWYARYDAYGNPEDAGTGARYDVPEWDSNGYYASLLFRRLQKTGRLDGNINFLRSLMQFPEGRLHENNLLFEGGIIEWPAYLPSTNMSLTAGYYHASDLASKAS